MITWEINLLISMATAMYSMIIFWFGLWMGQQQGKPDKKKTPEKKEDINEIGSIYKID